MKTLDELEKVFDIIRQAILDHPDEKITVTQENEFDSFSNGDFVMHSFCTGWTTISIKFFDSSLL